jgi:hypothetical protein
MNMVRSLSCRFREHAVLFHRGVGVIRKKDLFITQKIDLLVKYLVERPSKKVCFLFQVADACLSDMRLVLVNHHS